MLAQIEKIIHAAGFGQTERERASVYLTEAEAAAISASKQYLAKGEVFLVCDAGGGTTDLNVLKVECADRHSTMLLPLSWTEGEAVGSTVIDYRVRNNVKHRLARIQEHIEGGLEDVVSRMVSNSVCLTSSIHEDPFLSTFRAKDVLVCLLMLRLLSKMRDNFTTFKCSFGSVGYDVPKLSLPIPGMSGGMDFPHAGVEDSRIVITR